MISIQVAPDGHPPTKELTPCLKQAPQSQIFKILSILLLFIYLFFIRVMGGGGGEKNTVSIILKPSV